MKYNHRPVLKTPDQSIDKQATDHLQTWLNKSQPSASKVRTYFPSSSRSSEFTMAELQLQYTNYKNNLQQLAQKIGDVEQEAEEHKYVFVDTAFPRCSCEKGDRQPAPRPHSSPTLAAELTVVLQARS